jgi:hypothetical protein
VPDEVSAQERATLFAIWKAEMKHKCTLNCPETAAMYFFKWEITPPEGGVLLYRTQTDPSPQELRGPSGEGSIEILEPRTIYCEFLPGTNNFKTYYVGHRDLRLE